MIRRQTQVRTHQQFIQTTLRIRRVCQAHRQRNRRNLLRASYPPTNTAYHFTSFGSGHLQRNIAERGTILHRHLSLAFGEHSQRERVSGVHSRHHVACVEANSFWLIGTKERRYICVDRLGRVLDAFRLCKFALANGGHRGSVGGLQFVCGPRNFPRALLRGVPVSALRVAPSTTQVRVRRRSVAASELMSEPSAPIASPSSHPVTLWPTHDPFIPDNSDVAIRS